MRAIWVIGRTELESDILILSVIQTNEIALSLKALESLKKVVAYKNINATVFVSQLSKILTPDLIPGLLRDIKYFLSNDLCSEQGKKCYYQLITYCIQNLSYSTFYSAWHSLLELSENPHHNQ
jgi:hypothetical protein